METQEGFTGTDTLHLKCFFCSDLTTALIRMLLQCGLCWTFEETLQGVDQINEFDKNVEETFVHAFVFVLICIHTNFDRDWCWLS